MRQCANAAGSQLSRGDQPFVGVYGTTLAATVRSRVLLFGSAQRRKQPFAPPQSTGRFDPGGLARFRHAGVIAWLGYALSENIFVGLPSMLN